MDGAERKGLNSTGSNKRANRKNCRDDGGHQKGEEDEQTQERRAGKQKVKRDRAAVPKSSRREAEQ